MVFGLKVVCLRNAHENALLTGTIAAARLFSLTSLTLFLRSQNFKGVLKGMVTSVSFTQNTTVNFIEQYWGAAKLHFCTAGQGATLDEMKKVVDCLDSIELDKSHQ